MLNVSILLQKKFWFEKKLYFFCQEKPVYIFTLSLKVKIILGQKENLLSPFLTEKLLWRLTLEMHQSAPSSKNKKTFPVTSAWLTATHFSLIWVSCPSWCCSWRFFGTTFMDLRKVDSTWWTNEHKENILKLDSKKCELGAPLL